MHEIVWGKNDVDIQNAISYRGLNVEFRLVLATTNTTKTFFYNPML